MSFLWLFCFLSPALFLSANGLSIIDRIMCQVKDFVNTSAISCKYSLVPFKRALASLIWLNILPMVSSFMQLNVSCGLFFGKLKFCLIFPG